MSASRAPRRGAVITCLACALLGCESSSTIVASGIQAGAAGARVEAIRRSAAQSDRSAIPHLVERLDDEDVAVRFAAILCLEKITGTRLGFHYGASRSSRAAPVARWRRYVVEQASETGQTEGSNE